MTHESGHYFQAILDDLADRGDEESIADVAVIRTWNRANAADVTKDAMRVTRASDVSADDVIRLLDEGTVGRGEDQHPAERRIGYHLARR